MHCKEERLGMVQGEGKAHMLPRPPPSFPGHPGFMSGYGTLFEILGGQTAFFLKWTVHIFAHCIHFTYMPQLMQV